MRARGIWLSKRVNRVDQTTAMLIDSKQLLSLYDEAKDMLTETAEYFAGPGNPDQLSLTNENSLAYNQGSKCITARLMEIMAWLFDIFPTICSNFYSVSFCINTCVSFTHYCNLGSHHNREYCGCHGRILLDYTDIEQN